MNSAYVSAFAALAGSAIGALASFATTWLTQHFQDRVQRRSQEVSRQEHLFGDFIDIASKLYADALTNRMDNPSKIVPLYALMNKLRLFASERTILSADAVMKQIVEIYYAPNADFQSRQSVQSSSFDLLRDFTVSCRNDLSGGR